MHEQFSDPIFSSMQDIIRTLGGEPEGTVPTAGVPEPEPAVTEAGDPTVLSPERLATMRRLGIPVRLSVAPPEVRQSVVDDMTRLRVLAGEILPSNDEGVDLPRIDAFFTRRGFSVQPVTILTPDKLAYFLRCLKEIGYTSKSLEELGRHTERDVKPVASYEQRIGRIVALRPPGRLTPLQTFMLNYHIVHEKAHSTAGREVEDMVYTEDDTTMTRNCFFENSGFVELSTGEGIFIEEGDAERQTAKYVRDELHMSTGFWQVSNPALGPEVIAAIGGNEGVPLIYTQPSEAGSQPTMTIGALPAYGLELLINREPELEAALEGDRTSDESRDQITAILNSIQSGLGEDLMRIDNVTPGSFNAGLRRIKRVVAQ